MHDLCSILFINAKSNASFSYNRRQSLVFQFGTSSSHPQCYYFGPSFYSPFRKFPLLDVDGIPSIASPYQGCHAMSKDQMMAPSSFRGS